MVHPRVAPLKVCFMLPLLNLCIITRSDFLATMDKKHPVALPFRASLYSDAGFALLGVVLQRITGLTYNDAIQAALAAPLGLNSSTTFEPSDHDVNALILPGSPAESSWGFDNQVTAPYAPSSHISD